MGRPSIARAASLALAAMTGLVYAPFLAGEWVWDDRTLVASNASLRERSGLWTALTRDLFGGAGAPSGQVYRPIASLTLWAQAQLHGVALVPMRLGNVALLAAAAVTLSVWLRRQRVDALMALFAALLWALHPLGVEPTLWVSGRHDLLASLGVFGALALWPRAGERAAMRVLAASCACLAALLSKESGVVAPALLLLDALRRALSGEPAATRWRWHAAPFAALGVGFGLRRALGISTASATLHDGPLGWARTFGVLLREYVPRIVLGRSGPTIECWSDRSLAAGLAATTAWCALTCALAWAASRRPRDPGPEAADGLSTKAALAWAAMGSAWLGVALLPAVLALPFTHLVGNRYGHLPAAGVLVAAALTAARWGARALRPSVRALAAVAVLAWLVAGVVDEARTWHSDLTLYARSLAMAPGDGCARFHYGVAVLRRGGCEAALPLFVAAAAEAPDYARPWHNVAGCLLQAERYEDAIAPARRAVALDPDDPRKVSNLGAALLLSGARDEGRRWLRQALARDPHNAQALRLLRAQ